MKKIYDLEIIAGPCSVTPENAREIVEEIAPIRTPEGRRAIYGTRVVGLKSRTALNADGDGIGIDYEVVRKCLQSGLNPPNPLLVKGGKSVSEQKVGLPSVELADYIVRETGMLVATEIMIPHIQLPFLEAKKALKGNVLIWNPSVATLGWHLFQMNHYAERNGWHVGIKHGKFLGKDPLEVANHPDYEGETALEKVLLGLTTYVENPVGDIIVIHRGVDVPGRGDYRNAVVHEIMKRVKVALPKVKFYFDPTHSFGPKMRDHVVGGTLEAMKLRVDPPSLKLRRGDGGFLYDGILMEAGTSPTDAGEHVTVEELRGLVRELSGFRRLREPGEGVNIISK